MGNEIVAQQSTEAQLLQCTAIVSPAHSSPRDPLAGLSSPVTATKEEQGHNWGCPKICNRVTMKQGEPRRSVWREHGCKGTHGAKGQAFNLQLYLLLSPYPFKLALRFPSLHKPSFSRRVSEHCSSTQITLESFSLVGSEQWFSCCFSPEPLEALPKFPQDDKSWGGADSTTQQFRPGSKASPDLFACLGNLH